MSVSIELDPASSAHLRKYLKIAKRQYPANMWDACVKILFDMKAIAQNKLKADEHIVTSRLRNSIFVKTKGQKKARKASNNMIYTDNKGEMFNADLRGVQLRDYEGAIGTNVEYAEYVEKIDSFVEYSHETVDMMYRFRQAIIKAEKKLR